MMGTLAVLMLTALCAGCTSLQSLITVLEQRQVSSCIYYEGYVHGVVIGQGIGNVRGVVATGGATIDVCVARRENHHE